jgi:2',3'-cyclic-nucleotide 2'-phosphodiesterase (5'-nucleotidase family)
VFTILHTNDFHNRLTCAQAARLTELRKALNGNGLLLDAGDAISSGNITFRPGGEPILDQMRRIGYDALTVGNREFHLSRYGFNRKLFRAKFPILCANVRPSRCQSPAEEARDEGCADHPIQNPKSKIQNPPICTHLLHIGQGSPVGSREWRIVVFGLTVPMITERMIERKVSAYLFDDPLETARQIVPQLRAGFRPDLLIALTHIGLDRDRELARAVPDIDLIVGGHTHDVLEQGERVGETLIVQAGSHGRYYGRVEVFEPPLRESSGVRPTLHARLEVL